MSKPIPAVRPIFDYRDIDQETRRHLQDEAFAIRGDLTRIKTSAIEVGRRLLAVKPLLARRFGEWVPANCDFSARTAELFMSAAKFAEEHKVIAGKVSQTSLFYLAAPKLNAHVRQYVIEAVEKGDAVSSAEIKALIRVEKMKAGASDEAAPQEEEVPQAILEFASILIGALPDNDLERVRSLAASIDDVAFSQLAIALDTPPSG